MIMNLESTVRKAAKPVILITAAGIIASSSLSCDTEAILPTHTPTPITSPTPTYTPTPIVTPTPTFAPTSTLAS